MNEAEIGSARQFIKQHYPEIPVPKKSYLVLFSPRSGSNLLSSNLSKIGFGHPMEAFNAHTNHRQRLNWGIDFSDPYAYFCKAFSFVTVDGVMGMKLSYIQFKLFLENGRKLLAGFENNLTDAEIVEVFFPGVKYIQIQRRKKIKQAISLAKAIQNGVWFEEKGEDTEYKKYVMPVVYDREHIERCLDSSLINDIYWDQFLRRNNLPALKLFYEDMDAQFIEKMTEVYKYLGVEGKEIVAPQLRRQANKQSSNWEERFVAETPWLNDPEISKAYEEGDLESLYHLRVRMIVSERESERWRAMPINRFKTIRKFAFRVRRKLRSIFGID